MMTRPLLLPKIAILVLSTVTGVSAADFRQFVDSYCAECHAGGATEGGLDLSGLTDDAAVMRSRSVLRLVYDKLESRQMPPPKQAAQPADAERAAMLRWIEEIAARPDPVLGVRDPGKPVLRRLTRLEYNNSVRDLFGLDADVFMFPERLPIADRSYFQPATGQLSGPITITLYEYGAKYPVLCPQLGLPGDNRAEHGYRNRGDEMNFSPVLFETYLAAAHEIVNSPRLPERSAVAAELFGIVPKQQDGLTVARGETNAAQESPLAFAATGVFAPTWSGPMKTDGGAETDILRLRRGVEAGFGRGIGGVFDAGDLVSGASIVPGKGGLLRVRFADGVRTLTINPDIDLWLVRFSTAEATSGERLFCNRVKGTKQFELTLRLEGAEEGEGISKLAVCVLGRRKESGTVTLTARFTDGTETMVSAKMAEGPAGTQFVSFASLPGESIRSLHVDGSQFSGDYVLLDDLGFITNQQPMPMTDKVVLPPPVAERPVNLPDRENPTSTPPGGRTRRSLGERLTAFIERAFRRPVTSDDVAPYVAIFDEAVKQDASEADAVRAAVAAVLASPQFLFVEADGVPGNEPVVMLEDAELATRLALFLWASTPDDELLRLAKSGRLQEPAVLEEQTRRMLRDPRSRELCESFATQWLRLDQLYTAKPDRDLFTSFYSGPQGKSTLHGAMLTEAMLLFETVQIEDRSILDFIAADYSWLNPGLAKLYGIPLASESEVTPDAADTTRELKTGNAGPAWQRVPLPDARRGGFVTMAAPLVVTSLPFRTSPVKRGAWLLETIFNRPPTEPKVAFAIENDTKEVAQQMSVRRKFEAHRSQPACYSCHVRLDPPGFALERFGPIGQWRETDGSQAVDATGVWNGQSFDGPDEFKAILVANPQEFYRGFIEHLLSYALGRALQIDDMPTVAEIQRRAESDGWKFSRIVVEIVKSYPFTYTRRTPQ